MRREFGWVDEFVLLQSRRMAHFLIGAGLE
jgi:hypothetical protein